MSRAQPLRDDTRAPAHLPTAEIWIKQCGSRRSARYRRVDGDQIGWRPLLMSTATKALRSGLLTIGTRTFAVVVPRETQPEHPAAAGFAEQARALNATIDSLNAAARGAA